MCFQGVDLNPNKVMSANWLTMREFDGVIGRSLIPPLGSLPVDPVVAVYYGHH